MSTFQQRNARYKRLQTADINDDEHEIFKKYDENDGALDVKDIEKRKQHNNNTFKKRYLHHDNVNNNNNNEHDDIAHEEIELDRSELRVDGDGLVTDDYFVVGSKSTRINDKQGIEAGNIEYYATKKFMQKTIWTLAIILFYLTLSICLTFYQNSLLKSLKFPLCIVSYHMVFKFFMASCVRSAWKLYMGETRVLLDWRTNFKKMAPTGIASGIDIGLSTWGLELLKISLYTMTKSTTIVFITIFSVILGLEKKSWSLVLIVGLISSGLFMFTYKSTDFNLKGFLLLLVASIISGVRWSLAQFIIQKSQLGLHNPIDMVFHMQPWMIATLVPMAIVFEGGDLLIVIQNLGKYTAWTIVSLVFQVSFGALLAFFMECSEFLVVSKTSSLTLSIAGIFKEICQLALAVEFDHVKLEVMNVIGMIMCLMGITSHLVHKFMVLRHLSNIQILDNNDENTSWHRDAANSHNDNFASGSLNVMTDVSGKHSAQTVPLLDELTDSYDSEEDEDEPNASDVIYDVLKRRDMHR